jgi:septum formation protein
VSGAADSFKIILASKSPRRSFLLRELGFEFELRTKDVDESFPEHLKAEEIPLYLCRKKADAFLHELRNDELVITADTIVWIHNHVLNKPEDETQALDMLMELSGNCHEVFTGVSLRTKEKETSFTVRSEVCFREMTLREAEDYVRRCKPLDKAGSYGAQECLKAGFNPCSQSEIDFLYRIGKTSLIEKSIVTAEESKFDCVERINGSYFNVMGLPIEELFRMLNPES